MRKIAKQREEEGAEIDLTPMLDVVFIMLIFFIVVASFLKEAGLEINRKSLIILSKLMEVKLIYTLMELLNLTML